MQLACNCVCGVVIFGVERAHQSACKPGSVWRRASATAIHLVCPLPDTSSNQPGRRPENRPCANARRSANRARPPLFGLAPGGVYLAATVTRRAVRSYRTLSPLLPRRPIAETRFGGLLSVALSLGSPPAAVSRHRVSMEPGLSSTGRHGPQTQACQQRPSSRLVLEIRGALGIRSSGMANCPLSHPDQDGHSNSLITCRLTPFNKAQCASMKNDRALVVRAAYCVEYGVGHGARR